MKLPDYRLSAPNQETSTSASKMNLKTQHSFSTSPRIHGYSEILSQVESTCIQRCVGSMNCSCSPNDFSCWQSECGASKQQINCLKGCLN